MKRLLCLVLSLLLIAGILPLAAAQGNTVTLKVSIFDRGNTTNTYGTVTDNYWTRWVQKVFGDPNGITVEYVPIPRSEEAAKLNTLMASNSAPDIIFSYDTKMMMNFGKNGGLTELTGLLKDYAPNVLKNLASSLPYGTYMGQQFAVPAVRAKTGRYTNFIRKDMLDQMGYTLQKNEDGFYHMSVADFESLLYKAKGTDAAGMELFPLGLAGAYDATQAKPIIFAFVNRAGLTDEMAATTPQMLWPGFKEGVRFLNKLYNDKIIDPDFMIDTDTSLPSLNTQVSTGRALAFGQDDFYKNGIVALYENKPDADVVVFQLDNVNGEQVIPSYLPVGMYVAIPATSQNPEAAAKYLNFLADLDTCKTLLYGIEGVNYSMVDGIPAAIQYTDEQKATVEGYERITCGDMNLLFNGQPFGYKSSTLNLSEPEKKYILMYDEAIKLSKVGGVPDYYFQGVVTEAEETYDGFLPSPEKSLPQLISCPAAEFDALYDKTMNDYLNQGGQEIIDDKVELFRQLEAKK